MNPRLACGTLLGLLALTSLALAQQEKWGGESDNFKDVLLFGYEMPKGGIAGLPTDVRAAAISYRQRQDRFRSRLTPPSDKEWVVQITFAKHVAFERVIWSLFTASDIARVAADFVDFVPLPYEWEGMSEPPTAETEGAEAFLQAHPQTPIAPYLHLFVAHRHLCAASFLATCQDCRERDAHLGKFQAAIGLAKQARHALIRVVARELAERPTCYDEQEDGGGF